MDKWLSKKTSQLKCIDLLNNQHSVALSENRENLKKLIEIIILFSKQGLSFRGHDESPDTLNKGNFLEFVNWYSTKDKSLRNFISTKNASYCSKTIQNEIIGILSDQCLKNIVKSINQNQFYSLMVDE